MKFPKGQNLQLTYCDLKEKPIYAITVNPVSKVYFLYSIDDGGKVNQVRTANTPTKFIECYQELE